MADYVQIVRVDGTVDFVNRDQVARVHAEEVPGGNWIVKFLLSSGAEILDLRTENKEEAVARLTEITGVSPKD